MTFAAVVLVGCATTDDDSDARGGTYQGSDDALIEGANRGVNTNYFGPVNSGTEGARGPGTPSGNYDSR